jgi:hypothetical protein
MKHKKLDARVASPISREMGVSKIKKVRNRKKQKERKPIEKQDTERNRTKQKERNQYRNKIKKEINTKTRESKK